MPPLRPSRRNVPSNLWIGAQQGGVLERRATRSRRNRPGKNFSSDSEGVDLQAISHNGTLYDTIERPDGHNVKPRVAKEECR